MTNILAFSGSMRKGNTEELVKAFLKGAKKVKGTKGKHFLLRKLKPEFPCGRDSCWHTEKCTIGDGLTPLLKKIPNADALVLATPNYFNSVSSLFKIFIDRTNPFSKNRRFENIPTCLIIAGGYSQDANEKALSYLREFARIHRLNVIEEIKVLAERKDDVAKNKKLLKKIQLVGRAFAEKIIQ